MTHGANFHVVDQEQFRGARHGIDYGTRSKVLLRAGDRWLIWTPGHAGWGGTGCPSVYVQSCLSVSLVQNYRTLKRGGRLTAALAECAAAIDAEFGEGVHQLLEPGRTVVLGQ